MGTGATLDWLWWTAGSLLCAAGLAVLFWAMWWDRSRGRRRCPRCWYDMSATDGLTCPECGRAAKSERRLHRTRRRRRWAAFGVLLVTLGAATIVTPTVRRKGWGLVSTPLLVELVPIGGLEGACGKELMRRLNVAGPAAIAPSALSAEDRVAVVKRLGAGNWLARPLSARWQNSYGQVIRKTQRTTFGLMGWPGTTRDPALTEALRSWYDIPPVVSFRTRDRWPEGYNLWIETRERTYWPWPTPLSIDIRRHGTTGDPMNIWPNRGFQCREKEAGTGTASFDVTLKQSRQGDVAQDDWNNIPVVEISQTKVDIPYAIGGTIDEILTPVESATLDSDVASISYEVGPGWVHCDTSRLTGGSAEGIGFGVIMEFYLDGVLMAKERHWWDGSRATEDWDYLGGSEWVGFDGQPADPRSPWDAKPGEKWTIKIKSDAETALRVIDRDQYWKGEVEIPLIVQTE